MSNIWNFYRSYEPENVTYCTEGLSLLMHPIFPALVLRALYPVFTH